jgi:hypothetical protein
LIDEFEPYASIEAVGRPLLTRVNPRLSANDFKSCRGRFPLNDVLEAQPVPLMVNGGKRGDLV